jgi:hypothetical protein
MLLPCHVVTATVSETSTEGKSDEVSARRGTPDPGMVGVAWLSEDWSKGALLHYCLDATGWMWVFSTVSGVGEGVENSLFWPAVEV